MIRGMLSLMSGLGQGYNEGAQQKLENDRRAKLDQVTLDKAAREGTEFTQAQADRTSLRTAGAPVSAVPDMGTDPQGNPVQNQAPVPGADNPDAGPWDAPVTQGAQRVGMQGMLNPAQASAAVAQQNSPDGVLARQQAEVQRQNPAAGLQMQAHGLSVKSSQMDLADKDFDSNLHAAAGKGWDALGEFMNKSGVDPSASGKWLPSEDGKTMQAYKMGPNGELVPTGAIFDNSPRGLTEAATFFSHQVPITAKLSHYMAVQSEARKETHELNTDTYKTGMLGVARQQADTNEGYREDMGKAALERAERPGAAKSLVDRMTEADKMAFADTNRQREDLSKQINKAKAEGMWNDKDPGSQSLVTQLNALDMRAKVMTDRYDRTGAGAPDPIGVHSPSSSGGSTDTTRTPTKMQLIKQDAQATGVTNADIDVNGTKSVLNGSHVSLAPPGRMQAAAKDAAATAPPPAPPTAQPAVPAQPVPAPPAQFGFNGNARALNPNYAKWQQQYGKAWDQQEKEAALAKKQEQEAAVRSVAAARGPNIATRLNY